MAQKKLKLAFCMGGGVSLGAFSGGALAEILRQILYSEVELVLKGKKPKFESIEIDAFMGSSAGSVTLILMMRSLAYSLPHEAGESGEAWRSAKEDLVRVFKGRFGENVAEKLRNAEIEGEKPGEKLWKQLLGVARLDSIQRKVWVDGLSIKKLIPSKPNDPTFGGLLDGVYLGKLASELAGFRFSKTGELEWADDPNFGDRVLLGDRVVFGCTLSPLHPMESPLMKHFVNEPGSDMTKGPFYDPGMRSWLKRPNSRDARYFDVSFAGSAASVRSENWVSVSASGDDRWGELRKNTVIKNPDSWKEMVTTAVASGAFPGAFDPVVLSRHESEYGDRCPDALKSGSGFVEIPFVDGGMFNNQPVLETSRLCERLDHGDDGEELSRLIFHVDSSLEPVEPIRRFGNQAQARAEISEEYTSRRWGPQRRKRELGLNDSEKRSQRVVGAVSSVASCFFGQREGTEATPVFADDFKKSLPGFFGQVCSIVPVTARDGQFFREVLKGDPIAGFAGFFAQEWREHDFGMGRKSVYDLISSDFGRPGFVFRAGCGGGSMTFYDPGEPKDEEPDYGDIARRKNEVVEYIRSRARDITDSPIGKFVLHLITKKFLGEFLDNELGSMDDLEPEVAEAHRIQLVLPGEKWKMTTRKGLEISAAKVKGSLSEMFSVFDLLVGAFIDPSGVPKLDNGELYFLDFTDDSKITSLSFEGNRITNWQNESFASALLDGLRHGAIAVRPKSNAPQGDWEWEIYQPPNQIEFGLAASD